MSFVKDIKLVLLLYVVGDTITTLYALKTGNFYEGNPFLSMIFGVYGSTSIISLKIGFICLMYHVYRNAERIYWDITRHSVAGIGLFATMSNILGILGMTVNNMI